ncbi:hypothetical protein M432DRAFT_665266 [Thermoascus aurantiacus ATCC 26904]
MADAGPAIYSQTQPVPLDLFSHTSHRANVTLYVKAEAGADASALGHQLCSVRVRPLFPSLVGPGPGAKDEPDAAAFFFQFPQTIQMQTVPVPTHRSKLLPGHTPCGQNREGKTQRGELPGDGRLQPRFWQISRMCTQSSTVTVPLSSLVWEVRRSPRVDARAPGLGNGTTGMAPTLSPASFFCTVWVRPLPRRTITRKSSPRRAR